jgi:hypothetical protein
LIEEARRRTRGRSALVLVIHRELIAAAADADAAPFAAASA